MKKISLFFLFIISISIQGNGQDLIAHFPFDNSTQDKSGSGNDAKINGNIKPTSDRFGNPCGAYLFNGIDAYLEVPSNKKLKSPKKEFSVSVWVRLQEPLSGVKDRWLTIICKGNLAKEAPENPQYRMQVFQGAAQSTVSINSDFTEFDKNFTSHPIFFGKWHHYVLVYDGNMVKTYLDNQKIWEFAYSKELTESDMPLYIGKDVPGSTEFFCGAMDDLKIYSSAISEQDISKEYNENRQSQVKESFTMTCSKSIVQNTDAGKCTAKVPYPEPSIVKNCGDVQVQKIQGFGSNTTFPIGTTKIIYIATNTATGYKQACSFNITVKNNSKPEIKLGRDTIIQLTSESQTGFNYKYNAPKNDNQCLKVEIKLISGLKSGEQFPIGKTLVKYEALDDLGNKASAEFNVTVLKFIKPKEIVKEVPKELPKQEAIVAKKPKDSVIASNNKTPLNNGVRGNSSKLNPDSALAGNTSSKEKNKGRAKENISILAPDTTNKIPVVVASKEPPKEKVERVEIKKKPNEIKLETVPKKENEKIKAIVSKEPAHIITEKIAIKDSATLNDCKLTICIFDHEEQDGDIVSIFFDDEEIVDSQMLMLKGRRMIIKQIELLPNIDNILSSKAWNMGKYPPNTLKIEIYAGIVTEEMIRDNKVKPITEKIIDSAPNKYAGSIKLRCK